MDKNDTELQDLLNVDVNAIADKGVAKAKQQRKKSAKNVTLAVVILTALVIGLWGFTSIRNTKNYKTAIEFADAGQYEDAYSLFAELGSFKDSNELLDSVKTANDFASSALYTGLKESLTSGGPGFEDAEIQTEYRWRDREFSVTFLNTGLDVDSFKPYTPETLQGLQEFENFGCQISRLANEECVNNGFEISCSFHIIGSNGTPFFSSCNGTKTFGAINYEDAKNEMLEPVYQDIVSSVQNKNYAEAVERWDTFNSAGTLSVDYLDYEDLKEYYHYAHAMNCYTSESWIYLYDILDDFSEMPNDFLDAAAVKNEILSLLGTVKGEYQKGEHSYDRCNLSVDEDQISLSHSVSIYFSQLPIRDSRSEMPKEEKPIFKIENGKITQVKATLYDILGSWGKRVVDMKFDDNGVSLNCKGEAFFTGYYTK